MAKSVEAAPSSAETVETVPDDGSPHLPSSADGGRRRNRDKNFRRRRKGAKRRDNRLEKEVKIMMNPVVKILLVGLLMSFVDVWYIFYHLENNSEMTMAQSSSAVTEEIADSSPSEIDNPGETKQKSEDKIESKSDKVDPIIGREPIVKLIRDAGISFDPVEDADLIEELPLWSDVVDLYGPEPVIYGLNEGNCERFQAQSDKGDHFLGTAGTFNSGTNLMSELLIANCLMPDHMKKYGNRSRGIRWQVPWGKHAPAGDKTYRETHKTVKDKNVDAKEIMPIVTIRDPLIWLKSMCRHKYTARWEGFKDTDHCPNFSMKDLKTFVRYDGFKREYDSVLHLWNDYYNEYKNIEIPFLLVRFEDLVFRTEETVTKVCECGGGKRSSKKFKYIVNSAKKGDAAHGAMNLRTGFVDALMKYGKIEKRYKGFDSTDLEYVRDNIDQGLMEIMQYSSIDPSWKKNQQQTPI